MLTCEQRKRSYGQHTAWADECRHAPVPTDANHISVIDDPGVFGCMPWWTFQRPDTTRWTLGASDILFTNP